MDEVSSDELRDAAGPAAVTAYRATLPAYADSASLINGRGALRRSGRWHRRGVRTVYLCETPEGAVAEFLANYRDRGLKDSAAMPLVVAAVELRIGLLLDLCRPSAFAPVGQGQELSAAMRCFAIGLEGLVVPSVRTPGVRNYVVFPANLKPGSTLSVAASS